MRYDLIVIGMGLSGLMAAKTAVEAGRKVLLIGKGTGSLCLFSNTIDVLGSVPGTMRMDEGVSHWIKHHPAHPYSKVGSTGVKEALSSFLSLFPPPYSFQAVGEGNCLLPTGAGTLRPTYLVPDTMIAGSVAKEGDVLIVGFKGFKDFYAHYVADLLKCRGVIVSPPEIIPREITATALSRLMEKESFRENIANEIKRELRDETRVGFPAVLGVQNPDAVRKSLGHGIGAHVFEIPTLPPSIPGKRIFGRFREWLIRSGLTLLMGHPVSKATLKGKRVEAIFVSHPPVSRAYSADQYLLATGRFVGGGLVASEERISEPIFNLPVAQPRSREHWFGRSFFGDHPIHPSGILTDASFRPIDDQGDLVLENVRVAGSILAHHHLIEEKSREGIEIVTGYAATKHALQI